MSTSTTDISNNIENWDELNLNNDILRGIYAFGFEKPSPIQKQAILPMIQRRDIIAQAQSGTGKTGCFTVGTLAIIDTSKDTVQALLLSPTRELAIQTKSVLDSIASFVKNFRSQLLVGGTSSDDSINNIVSRRPQVVVGCPGRVYDMLRRKKLNSSEIKLLILDEADEILSFGFKEQIYNIFQYMPDDVQVGLFSATMPPEMHAITSKFIRDPVKILVKTDALTLEGISQYYVGLENDSQKFDCLKDIYESFSMTQCIIYCNSVRRVQDLYEAMRADNYPVGQIHSGMDKLERTEGYTNFKKGATRVLISSDVTSRGIDIQQVSTVINFDLPVCEHTYLHRVGRSGRWGRKGVAINLVTLRDARKLKDIEKHYSITITEMPSNWAESFGSL